MIRRTFGPLLPLMESEVAAEVEVVNEAARVEQPASPVVALQEHDSDVAHSSRPQPADISPSRPRDTVESDSRLEPSSSPMRTLQAKLHAFDKRRTSRRGRWPQSWRATSSASSTSSIRCGTFHSIFPSTSTRCVRSVLTSRCTCNLRIHSSRRPWSDSITRTRSGSWRSSTELTPRRDESHDAVYRTIE